MGAAPVALGSPAGRRRPPPRPCRLCAPCPRRTAPPPMSLFDDFKRPLNGLRAVHRIPSSERSQTSRTAWHTVGVRLAWHRLGVACVAIARAPRARRPIVRNLPRRRPAPRSSHRACGCPTSRRHWRTSCASTSIPIARRSPARSGSRHASTSRRTTCGFTSTSCELRGARWDGGELAIDPVKGDQMRAFRFGRIVEPGTVTLGRSSSPASSAAMRRACSGRTPTAGGTCSRRASRCTCARIAPCFDEPRFKTPWRVTLVVPRGDVALANTPEVSVARDRRREGGVVRADRADAELPGRASRSVRSISSTPARSANKVPVRVAVRAGEGKHVEHRRSAKLPAIVDAIEAYVDDALPLEKLDLVAVPHLFGAMENPGLITFDEAMLIGDPKATSFASYFVTVAAHEVAHQWFGNSVTPAWWDDLWLSEGFASWLGDKVAQQLGAIDDPPLRAALTRREAIEADDEPARCRCGARRDQRGARREVRRDRVSEGAGGAVDDRGVRRRGRVSRADSRVPRGASRALRRCDRLVRRVSAVDRAHARAVRVRARACRSSISRSAARRARSPSSPRTRGRDGAGLHPVLGGEGNAERDVRARRRATGASRRRQLSRRVFGNARGGYYHVAWAALPPPASVVQRDPRSRIIRGDDAAAALTRGELDAGGAASSMTRLDRVRAMATAARIRSRARRGRAREADRCARRRARAAAHGPSGSRRGSRRALRRVREGARRGRPSSPKRWSSSFRPTADPAGRASSRDGRARSDDQGRDRRSCPTSSCTLAASSGGDKLYARILERARKLARSRSARRLARRARAIRVAPDRAHGRSARRRLAHADGAGPRSTRTSRARRRVPRPGVRCGCACRRSSSACRRRVAVVIDATAVLCDAASRDEVAAMFEPRAKSDPGRRAHLDAALCRDRSLHRARARSSATSRRRSTRRAS